MKLLKVLFVTIFFAIFINNCGGTKKLTTDEYNQLSPQERVTYLEKQVKKNSEDVELKKMLYQEYLNMGISGKARPVMEEILTQDPYQADVQYAYGELLMKQGDKKGAYQAFLTALQSPGGSAYSDQVMKYLGNKFSIQQVTNSPAEEAFPSFSPDGSKIVYQTNRAGNWDIEEKDLASGEVKILVNTAADEELPCYSPDGKMLVFTSNANDKRPIDAKFKVRDIYTKDLTTGYQKNLTETVADDWLPRFSRDGETIVFVSERSDLRNVPYTEKQSDIYQMDSDGDFIQQLTREESNEGGACYSADGKKIFFHSNRNGSYDIFVMKNDGSNQMTVLGSETSNEVQPFVSPDSQHIVFFSDANGNYDIFQARIDGSEVEQLTFNQGNDTDPVYAPNGKLIAFQSDRSGNHDIYILNLEAKNTSSVQDIVSRLNGLIAQ